MGDTRWSRADTGSARQGVIEQVEVITPSSEVLRSASVQVGSPTGSGDVLLVVSPFGMVHLQPDHADKIADDLRKAAAAARRWKSGSA